MLLPDTLPHPYAELMKLRHAVSLAESQGSAHLPAYPPALSEGSSAGEVLPLKAAARLVKDPARLSVS